MQPSDVGLPVRAPFLARAAAEQDDAGSGRAAPQAAAAARRLGLHYLQRYFFLVAFRAYLASRPGGGGGGSGDGDGPLFSEWVAQRRELTYLASTLELE